MLFPLVSRLPANKDVVDKLLTLKSWFWLVVFRKLFEQASIKVFNYGIFVSEVNFIIELCSDVGSSFSLLSVVLLSQKTIVTLVGYRNFIYVHSWFPSRRLLCWVGPITGHRSNYTGHWKHSLRLYWKYFIHQVLQHYHASILEWESICNQIQLLLRTAVLKVFFNMNLLCLLSIVILGISRLHSLTLFCFNQHFIS